MILKFLNFITTSSLLLIFFSCSIKTEKNNSKKDKVNFEYFTNKTILTKDTVIPFHKVTKERIVNGIKTVELLKDSLLRYIYSAKKEDFEHIMLPIDMIYNLLYGSLNFLELMESVHPDDSIRNAATDGFAKVAEIITKLELNKKLYDAVKKYSESEDAKNLKGERKQFLNDILQVFNRSGLKLPEEKRKRIIYLSKRISKLESVFLKNIFEDKSFVEITKKESDGLDVEFLKYKKMKNGHYKLTFDKPTIFHVMKYAKNEQLRKKFNFKELNIAYPANIPVLDSILYYRREYANILGYKTYSEYYLADKMAKTPKNVENFIKNLYEKLQNKVDYDLKELVSIKKEITGNPYDTIIHRWDISYYSNLLKEKKYKLNEKEISKYFEINNVLKTLFSITGKLFGIYYKEIENPDVWYEGVKMYECYDTKTNELLGRFYLDLFPRKNKYNHFACFTIANCRKKFDGSYQTRTAALVCNFRKGTGNKASLMTLYELETLCHEFGHLLHALLTKTELAYFGGLNNVKRDFVEAPSQIWENWIRNKIMLKQFSKHYETGATLTDSIIERIIKSKKAGSGLWAVRQLFYASIDLTYHNYYIPFTDEDGYPILQM